MSQPAIPDLVTQEEPITCLTCYDYLTARLLDQVDELDLVLVGDTLGNVIQGQEDTLSVTVDDMAYHARAVSRGIESKVLVVDLPFMEAASCRQRLVEITKKLIGETRAQAIKVEGAGARLETVEFLLEHDIPVMGHLGLTPQSIHQMGGYRVQGTDEDTGRQIVQAAVDLQKAGIFSLVLECVPQVLATELSAQLDIPVIGIGAGGGCDGQVLVLHDLLGLEESSPKFVREYANLGRELTQAVEEYCQDVRAGQFPREQEVYAGPGDWSRSELKRLVNECKS